MIVLDLETAPLACAADYVPAPDLTTIQAARNLKDPAKIKEDLAKRQAEALASHVEKLGKAALDFNLARIVALGLSRDGDRVDVSTATGDLSESVLLEWFWNELETESHDGTGSLVGFCIRRFDVPMLMSRSRFLGVRYPRLDLGRYNRNSRIIDLWDELNFGLSDYDLTTVMPRKLKTYAKRYGIPVEDDINGADIPALVEAGNWEAVIQHVTSDVRLTAALAQRLGVLKTGVAA
jgi:predicted PolB exonuclease-like 3'-5' exonuclease